MQAIQALVERMQGVRNEMRNFPHGNTELNERYLELQRELSSHFLAPEDVPVPDDHGNDMGTDMPTLPL